jgi:hypothetical protein
LQVKGQRPLVFLQSSTCSFFREARAYEKTFNIYGPFGGPVLVVVIVVTGPGFPPVVCTLVDCVTETDGMIARIGAVMVSTTVFAEL